MVIVVVVADSFLNLNRCSMSNKIYYCTLLLDEDQFFAY